MFLEIIGELGVRRGEALAVTWGAVDFVRWELSVSSHTSKGRRDGTFPASESLLQRLSAWRDAQPLRPESSDPVLPWGRKMYRAFYEDWGRIIAAAGLPKGTKPVPKNFRSTCGRELIQAGAPTVVVKDFLSNASVTTTEAFHINTGPALRAAAERRRAMMG